MVEKMHDISFIVPVYNSEEYLKECVESLLSQDGVDKEIILIDDGSTDNSRILCKNYRNNFDVIIYIEQNHEGASIARNKGIDIASGKWICFVDSDDYLNNNIMANILENINDGVDICFMNYMKVDENKVPLREYVYSENTLTEFCDKDFEVFQRATLNKTVAPPNIAIVTPWAKLYRRDFLKKNRIFFTPGVRKSQDVLFNFEAYEYAHNGLYINEMVYFYRYNKGSLCNKYMDGIINDYYMQLKKIDGLLKINKKSDIYKNDFYVRAVVNFMFAIQLDFSHRDNRQKYMVRKKCFKRGLELPAFAEAFNNVDLKSFCLLEKLLILCIKKHLFAIICLANSFYRKK